MARLLVALLLLLTQQPLRVKVSLVTVGVRVTDSKGRNALNLKEQDFSVFDDGVPQKIDFFSSEQQPITLGILLDRSFSMSYNSKLERAKDAARSLIRSAHDGSEYFYVTFDDQVNLASDFTNDRDRVQASVQQTSLGGGTSLYDAVIQGIVMCSRAQLPRQALIIISDGADAHSRHELQETMSIVRESEMQIYTIGYFGPEEDRLFRKAGPRVELADGRMIDNPRDVLDRIARESGAASFFPRTDAELVKAVEEITRDLQTQYTLAFYPQPEESEKRYHQLRVAVRGERLNVRARPGYGTLELAPAVARRANSRAFESKVEHRNGHFFYSDNFSDVNSGWPDRVTEKYSPEGYRLTGEAIAAVNGPVFRNFRASVLVTTDVAAGLVFRQNDAGYYAFAVSSDVATVSRIASVRATLLDSWPIDAVDGPAQRIEVRCDGSECAFYHQDALLGRIKDNTFAEGRIGLYLSEKGSAMFNDLNVEEIR